jgi:hypothetical protein
MFVELGVGTEEDARSAAEQSQGLGLSDRWWAWTGRRRPRR